MILAVADGTVTVQLGADVAAVPLAAFRLAELPDGEPDEGHAVSEPIETPDGATHTITVPLAGGPMAQRLHIALRGEDVDADDLRARVERAGGVWHEAVPEPPRPEPPPHDSPPGSAPPGLPVPPPTPERA